MRYLVPLLILTAALVAVDYYVYRAWRRFARVKQLRWTLYVYRILLVVMPLTLPIYLNMFSWWEVEPRWARALFFACWAVYYVPKIPIAGVLLISAATRLVRRREASPPVEAATPGITRSEFLQKMGWMAAAVPFVATGYGAFRTLYDFSVHRIDVPISGLPRALEGITIAQLSDLHAGSLFGERPMRDAVELVRELQPDLVALTGDYVNHDVAETPNILPALNELDAHLGVFGCLGNHDHYADTRRLVERLDTTPMQLLVNAHRTIEIDGAQLHIIGTDNTGFRQHFADLPQAVRGIEPDRESVKVLLAHDPTFWDDQVRPNHSDIDLMLCGHTHGGQFGVEFGPIRWSLAQMRYERWAGLYAEPRAGEAAAEQYLYVNRGIGTVGPPLRLGIRPEITFLTLRRA